MKSSKFSRHDKRVLAQVARYNKSVQAKRRRSSGVPLFGRFTNLGLRV